MCVRCIYLKMQSGVNGWRNRSIIRQNKRLGIDGNKREKRFDLDGYIAKVALLTELSIVCNVRKTWFRWKCTVLFVNKRKKNECLSHKHKHKHKYIHACNLNESMSAAAGCICFTFDWDMGRLKAKLKLKLNSKHNTQFNLVCLRKLNEMVLSTSVYSIFFSLFSLRSFRFNVFIFHVPMLPWQWLLLLQPGAAAVVTMIIV